MAVIRPWVDNTALHSKGRRTSYKDGTIRDWVDSVALANAGRKTSYSPDELGIPTIFITGNVDDILLIDGRVDDIIPIEGVVG